MLKQTSIRDTSIMLASTALVLMLPLLNGCKESASKTARLDSEAQEYVQLAVGLGQRDSDSLDFYSGPQAQVSEVMKHPPTLPSLRESAVRLLAKVEQVQPERDEEKVRKRFLTRQLQAMVGRIDLVLGRPSSFDAETKASFGVVVPASYDRAATAAVQSELDKLLPGDGSLAERYQAFDNRFIVPPKLVPAVMARAIEACRTKTKQHIELPAGEAVSVEYVRNKPWSAYSWYKGGFQSVVQVNMDFALTVDRIMNLACHEAYPGHHTYNSIRDVQLVQGRNLKEYSVQPTFSPQSMLSESIATLAADVAFPEQCRLELERDVLFPIAGLNGKDAQSYLKVEALVDRLHTVEPTIAREYLDGRLEFERAGAELESAALMAHPEAVLLYMNEYRSYVATYTYGRDLAAAALLRRSGGDRNLQWKVYSQWMSVDPQMEERTDSSKVSVLPRAGGG
ncbi:MAG: hypothetical protein JWM43_2172 [Acidobacteriaceae bacterium]|nr:hypothetical protein [Acidobacteriaceae bacterium]